MEDLFIYWIW